MTANKLPRTDRQGLIRPLCILTATTDTMFVVGIGKPEQLIHALAAKNSPLIPR